MPNPKTKTGDPSILGVLPISGWTRVVSCISVFGNRLGLQSSRGTPCQRDKRLPSRLRMSISSFHYLLNYSTDCRWRPFR
jgi:hypothetical protein